jgi:hypothetical protein
VRDEKRQGAKGLVRNHFYEAGKPKRKEGATYE